MRRPADICGVANPSAAYAGVVVSNTYPRQDTGETVIMLARGSQPGNTGLAARLP